MTYQRQRRSLCYTHLDVLPGQAGRAIEHNDMVRTGAADKLRLARRRGIGLASTRRDGWVSLEAGRTEGRLVTMALPLEKPMALEVNANVYSGYLAVDVLSAVPGKEQQPVPAIACRDPKSDLRITRNRTGK